MTETLRARLAQKPIVVAPGVYDAFTALVATQAGFATLYVSGAAIAYTRRTRIFRNDAAISTARD